ncbi:hypothetical protein [Aeromicrobium sp.]|uniref:hypothetical protein n=1 Tax=Aeromicrobium sp. TaxID=1871063 RepID=UPI0030BD5AFC
MTAADLAERIGGPSVTGATPKLVRAFNLAVEQVDLALVDAFRPMSDATYTECVLSVGYAAWDRTKSSAGTKQTTVMEGQYPVRAPADLLASIRPLLAKHVLGFA